MREPAADGGAQTVAGRPAVLDEDRPHAFVALRASPELTALNLIACTVLAGLVVHGFSGSLDLANLKLWEIAARPIEGWAKSLWSAATPLKESVDTERAGAFAKTHGGTVLRAVLPL